MGLAKICVDRRRCVGVALDGSDLHQNKMNPGSCCQQQPTLSTGGRQCRLELCTVGPGRAVKFLTNIGPGRAGWVRPGGRESFITRSRCDQPLI